MSSIGTIGSLKVTKVEKANREARLERFSTIEASRCKDVIDSPALKKEKKKQKKGITSRIGGVSSSSSTSSSSSSSSSVLSMLDSSLKRIKGKSKEVEKSYLRLTGAADAAFVRPEKVLKEALENVKAKYAQNKDYIYLCDQLKSIRQDLTLQRIKGMFCVHVYETHARVALVHADESEFVQCQSRLQEMRQSMAMTSDEFDCYRILYSLYAGTKLDLASILIDIDDQRIRKNKKDQHQPATEFAMSVALAVRNDDSARFFELYAYAREKGVSSAVMPYKDKDSQKYGGLSADQRFVLGLPHAAEVPTDKHLESGTHQHAHIDTYQACYMMDFLIAKERTVSLQRILKAYIALPFRAYCMQLGFNDKSEGIAFAVENQLVIVNNPPTGTDETAAAAFEPDIDCKASNVARTAPAASSVSRVGVIMGSVKQIGGGEGGNGSGNGGSSATKSNKKRKKREQEEAAVAAVAASMTVEVAAAAVPDFISFRKEQAPVLVPEKVSFKISKKKRF